MIWKKKSSGQEDLRLLSQKLEFNPEINHFFYPRCFLIARFVLVNVKTTVTASRTASSNYVASMFQLRLSDLQGLETMRFSGILVSFGSLAILKLLLEHFETFVIEASLLLPEIQFPMLVNFASWFVNIGRFFC